MRKDATDILLEISSALFLVSIISTGTAVVLMVGR